MPEMAGEVTVDAEAGTSSEQPVTTDFRLYLLIVGLAIWVLFQIPRLIAVPLVRDNLAGLEPTRPEVEVPTVSWDNRVRLIREFFGIKGE